MRPIYFGVLFFIIGAVGWVFSVVLAVVTFGTFKILALIFGILFLASLPLGLLGEIIRWLKKRKHQNDSNKKENDNF